MLLFRLCYHFDPIQSDHIISHLLCNVRKSSFGVSDFSCCELFLWNWAETVSVLFSKGHSTFFMAYSSFV